MLNLCLGQDCENLTSDEIYCESCDTQGGCLVDPIPVTTVEIDSTGEDGEPLATELRHYFAGHVTMLAIYDPFQQHIPVPQQFVVEHCSWFDRQVEALAVLALEREHQADRAWYRRPVGAQS